MNKERLIYCLKCPFTNQVHYIGKSTQGMIGPLEHMKSSHSDKVKKWVEELNHLNYKPVVEIITYVSKDEDIDNIEEYYIKKYVNEGALLLNSNLVKPDTILPNLEEQDPEGLKSIGIFIKEKRKRVNLTQKQLSDYSGVAVTVIRKLEQGSSDDINTKGIVILLAMFGHKLSIERI